MDRRLAGRFYVHTSLKCLEKNAAAFVLAMSVSTSQLSVASILGMLHEGCISKLGTGLLQGRLAGCAKFFGLLNSNTPFS